jgi:hypothetical protein
LHDLKNLLNVVKNYDHRGREERESLSKKGLPSAVQKVSE